MNRKIFSYGLVAALLTTSVGFNAKADKEDAGAIIGGIIGGVIGSKIGKGDGKVVATGLGIIVGAIVGADIGGTLDDADRRALSETQRDVFLAPIGERRDWDGNRYGSRTGNRGHFRTTREGYLRSNSREVCREYESVIVTRNRTETRTGIACSSANGSWREVTTSDVVFRDVSSRPVIVDRPAPRPVQPDYRPDYRPDRRPPVPVRPTPDYGQYGSLRGYCPDHDHQQFYAAKNFAYSTSGLNMNSNDATNWGLQYNQGHRCGTISEYQQRHQALKNFAYSTSGLNMNSSDAIAYANQRVETLSVYEIQAMQSVMTAVKNFVYATNGLNRDSATAARVARDWAERGTCGDAVQVQQIWNAYSKEYSFAYSTSGLNMNSSGARDYAINKVSRMTRCSDLLRY